MACRTAWEADDPSDFTTPQQLRRIWLVFEESTVERTQEYVLRWSSDGGEGG